MSLFWFFFLPQRLYPTGNIQSSDFINVDESAMGVGMITIYTILVVIIMLNLLISIVDKVYDDTMRHQQTEFVKAKAQIINVGTSLCWDQGRSDSSQFR